MVANKWLQKPGDVNDIDAIIKVTSRTCYLSNKVARPLVSRRANN